MKVTGWSGCTDDESADRVTVGTTALTATVSVSSVVRPLLSVTWRAT